MGILDIALSLSEVSVLGEQSDVNESTHNKTLISLSIRSPNFLASAEILRNDCISDASTTLDANLLWLSCEGHPSVTPPLSVRSGVNTRNSFFGLINVTLRSASLCLQTEEEVSVGGYCQPKFLADSGASLAPQQGSTTCCQDDHRPRRAGKQLHQLPALQPPLWRAEEGLHHR